MKKAAIIGVGALGIRHLQALSQLEDIEVQIVDPSIEALEKAENILDHPKAITTFFKDITQIHRSIDIAVIATNSSIRKQVIEELLINTDVKYLILEKVLFPAIKDYCEIKELFDKRGIKAWVNCPRRIFDFYKELKEIYKGASHINLNVSGVSWGIGCNSIHFIDLLAFLSDTAENLCVNSEKIDREILESKRKGFIEFTGTLSGSINERYTFNFISNSSGNDPFIINIDSDIARCTIIEPQGFARLYRIKNNWKEEIINFTIPYQSQMTDKVAGKILYTGECDLTTFEESIELHVPLIEGLLTVIKEFGENTDICNIT